MHGDSSRQNQHATLMTAQAAQQVNRRPTTPQWWDNNAALNLKLTAPCWHNCCKAQVVSGALLIGKATASI
jgi:hypothetical protein